MAEVSLKNVSKTFPGGIQAVRDFNLEVRSGEFVVLVGPSGCGKSTTLRIVAGLEEPTSGVIAIGGRVVNDVPPRDRDIAMVFQNYALYPHMTARENMEFGLKLRRVARREIETRIRDAAEILGLSGALDRRPKALSGGQWQRVAVGRAIVRKPAAFLFDEPLSNLDAKLRVQMRVEISRLHHQLGATMIYVTHDQIEAMTMGERIVVMKDGLVQQVADPMAIYRRPANLFVAGFIGAPAMNFFEGRIQGTAESMRFESDDGFSLPAPAERRSALAAYADRAVTAGIRPEDIGSAAAEANPGAPRIRVRVDVVEPMGAETYVHLRAGRVVFVMRVESGRACAVGSGCDAAVAADKAHYFDPQTGSRIE
ncbi:MAG: sn-glycerol-3-phosphate ABC transporter ATP-binding protein UgpC [Verrucomicrobiota bacterium]|nr:sn-glycerol-3-phosphate ABC transporter ATP-binding protein UgpC [Verrucomicrobiota bacterium]